jgi:hypothetical protein
MPSMSNSLDLRAEIAVQMLRILYTFSDIVDAAGGGLEGYQRVLLGCLDVLAVTGGADGVTRLLKALDREYGTSDGKDSFVLVVGEELVRLLKPGVIRDVLLSRAERWVTSPSFMTRLSDERRVDI